MPGTSIPALPQGPIAEVGKDGKIYVTRPWYIGFLRVWKNAIGTSDPPPQEPGGGTGVDPGNIEILSQGDIVYQTNPDTKQQEAVWPLVLRAPNNSDLASVTVWLARPASDVDVLVGDLSEITQDFPFEGGPHDEFTINVVVPCNDEAEKVRAFVTANSETFIGKLDRATTPSTWNIISGRLLVPPITGFAVGVDVKTDAAAFDKMGRYYWVWNVPATPNFKEAWIQRRWTYPNWTAPAPPEYGGNWGTVAFDRTPASQIDYWPMVAEEWHEWRIIPVNWAGVPNYTDAQIVQVHVIPGQGIKVGNGITNNNGTLESTVQGGSLINNGGFEQGLADWTNNLGVVQTATVWSGTKALQLGPGAWVKQKFKAPIKPGDAFYAEAYLKSATSTLATVAFYFKFFDAAGTALTPVSEVYVSPATTWGTAVAPATIAPANATQAEVTVHNYHASATCYVDGVVAMRAVDLRKVISDSVASHLGISSGVFGVLPSAITASLIHDAAITTTKLVDGAVANNKIAPFAVDAAKIANAAIQNAHLDRATADKIAIVDADIVNLSAAKITAGTLAAGVIYGGTVNANQVNAGDFNGCTLTLTANDITTSIKNEAWRGGYAGVRVSDDIIGRETGMGTYSFTACQTTSAGGRIVATLKSYNDYGELVLANAAGTTKLYLNGSTGGITTDGHAGLTTTVGYAKSGGGTGTLTFTNGILTGSS